MILEFEVLHFSGCGSSSDSPVKFERPGWTFSIYPAKFVENRDRGGLKVTQSQPIVFATVAQGVRAKEIAGRGERGEGIDVGIPLWVHCQKFFEKFELNGEEDLEALYSSEWVAKV